MKLVFIIRWHVPGTERESGATVGGGGLTRIACPRCPTNECKLHLGVKSSLDDRLKPRAVLLCGLRGAVCLGAIRNPTLVMAGSEDAAAPARAHFDGQVETSLPPP